MEYPNCDLQVVYKNRDIIYQRGLVKPVLTVMNEWI